ncbi:NADH oxidase [uncultured Pleomorphomonas sp.]|uniref:NADH oxidase n=1 Tax=uncultured Pleomorphomonas sp. TaxID=442121 RepID=A0A212LPD1_9HYPH|nr:FAD-dependent oxidoreductase [uncultured Pleomorphomonas sp.]SCM79433.1 NADH oxidase [uncultured Pleomorphomonas sp.]
MFTHLFSKGRIGTLELKNRVVMSPMGNYLANADGSVSDADIAFYTARAKGGVGLIFTECMIVDYRRGKGNTHQIAAADDRFIAGLERLADSVHAHDARIIGQIYHPGRQGVSAINENLPMLAPSVTECGVVHQPTAAMTTAEVEDMVGKFAAAALRLKKAGLDGVEVHGAHGYLVNEFLSPYTNRRDDRYGGSFDNRLRFLAEIVEAIRRACGPDFPLVVRLSVDEFVEGQPSLKLEDGVRIAQELEKLGVDAIDVSAGIYETMSVAWEPTSYGQGWKLYLSEAVKKAVKVPVIGVAAIRDPAFADKVLEEGKLDFVGSARQHFADPEWANKAKQGRIDDIRRCISCLFCMETLISADFTHLPCRCAINIEAGREIRYGDMPEDGDGRVVAVIGGGPAGLEAARILARRKFRPVIFEKQDRLGGQLLLAEVPPGKEKIGWLLDWLVHQVEAAGVEVRLGEEATVESLAALKPYAVLVAAGSEPFLPPNLKRSDITVTATDVLSGQTKIAGSKVAVIGSGMTGIETAELLANGGNEVTVFEMADAIGPGLYFQNLLDIMAHLKTHDVDFYAGHRLVGIDGRRAVFEQRDTGETRTFDFDRYVLSLGNRPTPVPMEHLTGAFDRVFLLGDAAKPGRIRNALETGYQTAFQL